MHFYTLLQKPCGEHMGEQAETWNSHVKTLVATARPASHLTFVPAMSPRTSKFTTWPLKPAYAYVVAMKRVRAVQTSDIGTYSTLLSPDTDTKVPMHMSKPRERKLM